MENEFSWDILRGKLSVVKNNGQKRKAHVFLMSLFLLLFYRNIGRTHEKYLTDQNDRKIFSCDFLRFFLFLCDILFIS